MTVTISVAFGCPFEGRVDPGVVEELADRWRSPSSADRPSGHDRRRAPRQVRGLVERTRSAAAPAQHAQYRLRERFAALEAGATLFDAACGGLGGCPFAPRATGNIATEDLAYLLNGDGVETGIDLDALIATSAWLEGLLGRRLEGQVYRAGAWTGD